MVKDGRVVGRGWTQASGRPHAEAVALQRAGEAARGATLYVTLEPCAHPSPRGPACADLTAASGLARVVVAVRDPDPRTSGAGFERIVAAGIATALVPCAAAEASLAGYLSQRQRGRPYITLKLALSLDGCIALASGESQWISGPEARAHAHLERARSDAILVGGGTLRADAPRLDVRLEGLAACSSQRWVLTSRAVPKGWSAIASPDDLGAMADLQYLLVEGGAQTAAAFLRADLVDRLLIYRAPIVIGGGLPGIADIGLTDLALAHGRWRRTDTRHLGNDTLEVYERQRPKAVHEKARCSPA